MLKTGRLIAAMAIAMLALPAMAGSPTFTSSAPKASARLAQPAPANPAVNVTQAKDSHAMAGNGFEYVGGESDWQVAQHKYVWTTGEFTHSNDCDHAIRTVQVATPAELESFRQLYPGG